jgi:hypothetical protein
MGYLRVYYSLKVKVVFYYDIPHLRPFLYSTQEYPWLNNEWDHGGQTYKQTKIPVKH